MTDFEQRYVTARKAVIARDLARLNPMQRQGAMTTEGPLLLLAGAGSGKTTVLIQRVYNLLTYGRGSDSDEVPNWATEEDLDFLEHFPDRPDGDEVRRVHRLCAVDAPRPWEIIAITFTNKAAGELKERLAARLGPAANDVWASTFHSACVRILRRDIDRIGFDKDFTIYDTDDAKRVIKDILKEQNLDEKTFPIRSVLSAISASKDRYEGPEVSRKKAEAANDWKNTRIAKIYAAYQQKLSTANALDFDDLIFHTVTLLRTCPEVLEYYQRKFRYVLVDEYQDTNHLQYLLTALLAGGRKNLCVVGDDDQSIYRFRGATIENILSFEKQYKNAKVIRLEQNYRSTQTILDAANAVIANNEQRKGKNLWTDNGQGAKIEFYVAEDELAESRHVADTIVSNVADGEEWNDHAVLYRMNAQSNLIEQSFIRSGVPYRMIGGHRFYDRKEIKDAMAYLYVVNNTADEIRLRRIINEPKRGIGETSLNAVFEIANGLGVEPFEVIRSADQYAKLSRASSKLMAFGKLIDSFREKLEIMPLADLLGVILDETGYTLSLANEPEKYQERVANLSELGNNIRRYCEENPDGDLNGFLQETALLTDIDNYNAQTQAVVMMTIHSAKGLEFPNVFIVGMEEGIFPGMQTILYEPENIEEERRLAYVAITRAKKKLYISSASTRMLYGMTNRNRPSRFVEEIPDELLDKRGARPMSYQTYGIPQQRSAGQGSASRGFSKPSSQSPARASNAIPQKPAYGFSASPGFSGAGSKKPAAAAQSYSVGETVKHKAYGTGVILGMQKMANDTMLEIAFEKVGTKKIMANYTKIKKI